MCVCARMLESASQVCVYMTPRCACWFASLSSTEVFTCTHHHHAPLRRPYRGPHDAMCAAPPPPAWAGGASVAHLCSEAPYSR